MKNKLFAGKSVRTKIFSLITVLVILLALALNLGLNYFSIYDTAFLDMTQEREIPETRYVSSSKREPEECQDVKATEEKYIELLTKNIEREIYAGSTLYGAHKDDMAIDLNGKAARLFASQGQQRSLSIALKLAEGEIIREEYGDYPVFLFDDVLSELDAKRRDYLINRIDGKQVIMTCCDKNEINNARLIRVQKGKYYTEE